MKTQIRHLLVSLGLIAAAGVHAGTFSDDFSTGLNPSYWGVIQQTPNYFSVDVSHGDVRLAKGSVDNPGGIQGIYIRLNFALFGGLITNDFSTQIDFTNAVVPGPGLDQVELHTYYEDGSIWLAVYDDSSGDNVHVWDGGSVLGTISVSQNYGTFLISRTNGVVTAYFNGTPIYAGTRSSPLTEIEFTLQNNNGSDDPISVIFDNFSLSSPSVSPPSGRSGSFYFVGLTNVANFTWAAPDTVPGEPTATRLPGAPIGMVTLGGVPFNIATSTNGKQAWHADIAANGGSGQVGITNAVNIYGATTAYSLVNTWCGQPGPNAYAWLVFTGSGGASYTKSLVGGSDICDYNHGPWENSINGTTTINVFSCLSDNWGNPGRLDMQQIPLPPDFATQTLVSIALVDNGGPSFQRVVLDGLTVETTRAGDFIIAAAVTPGGINMPERTNNGVLLYRYDGTTNGALQLFATILPTPQNGLYDPAGVVFSPWGELFVGNRQGNQQNHPGSGSICRFLIDASGQVTPNGVITGNGLWAVHGLAFNPPGELFAANLFADVISRFTFDGNRNAIAHGTIGASAGSSLEGLAFSPSAELFASTYSAISRYRFDASGNAIANGVIADPGSGRLHFLRFNAQGELFAPDIDDGLIYRFKFDNAGNAIPNGSFAAAAPTAQTFSPAGELFVSTHAGPPLYNTGSLARFTFDAGGNAVTNGTMASDTANDPLGGLAVRLLDFPPTLSVARTATNTAMVYWPSASTGWNLQVSTNLATTNWVTPPETVQDNGTNKYIIVNPPDGNRFFRLSKQ
jgi:hypothetical protein